ncbi:MAG: tetratricopeptide repeat protein, partial [Rhodothermia bacterium]|nr:tetratricopeptide repeat protein [Rhodothermia bacterium]
MQLKPIAFKLGAILLPILLLVILELVLRVAGVGRDARTPFRDIPGQPDYLAFNPEYAKKYFKGFDPAVAFDPFLAEKTDSVFRVFTLGGSSTAGFPYHFYYGFPARLQARLEALSPTKRIEIVNLGLTAVNSFTIWDLREAVIRHRPDAVVIYAGHNEYYGAFGAGSTIYQLGNKVWMKRLLIGLKGTALFSLVDRALNPTPDKSGQDPSLDRTMMARVIGNRAIKLDDEVFQAGIRQFERNMTSTLDAFADENIPVFIGTLVSNLADQKPLGEDEEAVEGFRRGRELLQNGDTTAARQEFVEAKEKDDIRFRAPEQINRIIRSFDEREGVYVLDIGNTFREQSASGLEDNSLFDDHLHPNHVGYDLIAEQFYQAITDHPAFGTLEKSDASDRYELDPFERTFVTAQLARLKSGYPFVKGRTAAEEAAAYRSAMDRLFARGSYVDSLAVLAAAELGPPYELLHQAVRRAKADRDTLSALLMYRSLLYWQPFNIDLIRESVAYAASNDHYSDETASLARFGLSRVGDAYFANVLAAVRIRQGHYADAEILLRALERQDPASKPMLFNRARLLVLQGDTALARQYYLRYSGELPNPTAIGAGELPEGKARNMIERASDALGRKNYRLGIAIVDSVVQSYPDLPDAHFVRGRLLFEMDRLGEAADAFRQVTAINPTYPGAFHNLGNAHFRDKKYREAVDAYLREAQSRPTARAWHAVGGAYWQLGLSDSSKAAYEKAVTLDDSYAPVHLSLTEWHEASGDYSEALRYAQRAAELEPNNVEYRYRLGVLLARNGQLDEAAKALEDVVRVRPWDFSALFNLGQTLQQLGRQAEARTVLARAEQTQMEQQEVNRLRGGARDFPENFEARIAYADALRKSGRVGESIDQYLIAEALRPNNLALRNNIATAYLQ